MSSIVINKLDYSVLNSYIGQGKPDASLVFFGNEPGTSGKNITETIEHLKNNSYHQVGTGFLLKESYTHPTTSDFARFISRLCLGLKYKDERWFNELSPLGKIAINEHILKPISEKNICLINLRPLPRPTESTWTYSNIDKKDYLRKYNFTLKKHYSDKDKEDRLNIFKTFFSINTKSLIIGIGDKENKKRFFEYIYPDIKFHEADLNHISIYFNIKHKIILSNYFNNRNGIKIKGLKDLYHFITSRKLI